MNTTRETIERKIRELAEREATTPGDMEILERAYAELAKNDWMPRITTNTMPSLSAFGGPQRETEAPKSE